MVNEDNWNNWNRWQFEVQHRVLMDNSVSAYMACACQYKIFIFFQFVACPSKLYNLPQSLYSFFLSKSSENDFH